jgi:hypothetical protein
MEQLYPCVKTVRTALKNFSLIICLLFTNYLVAQPTISSFTPASGPVGTTVTITGTGFNTTPANNTVYFGTAKATVSAATTTSLTVTVPAFATYQPITVTTNYLTAYSAQSFVVTFPANEFSWGMFETKVSFPTNRNAPKKPAIGDLDGDGKPEIVVPNYLEVRAISIFKNTSTPGKVSLTLATEMGVPQGPADVALGDLNGDGKLDIFVGCNLSINYNYVYWNTSQNGTLSFDGGELYEYHDNDPRAVAIRDFDGDGLPDVVTANGIWDNVVIYRNISNLGGHVYFAAKKVFDAGKNPSAIAVGDFDGDGKADFATANANASSMSVFRNTSTVGNISFSRTDITTADYGSGICAGDFNGDGKTDLAKTNASRNSISIYKNACTPGTIAFSLDVESTGNDPLGIAAGDLNGDGKIDLVTADPGLDKASVFMNYSTATTSSFPVVDFFSDKGPKSVSIGDIDGDGLPDIVTANETDNTISILRRNATPAITSFTPTSGGAGTTITISGNNFTGATAVTIGGTAVTSFNVVSSTSITAVVAAGSQGVVAVTTPYGTATRDGFTLPAPAAPAITAAGNTTFCDGGNVTLTSSVTTNNQWYKNGTAINGATAATYVASTSGSYAAVTVSNGVNSPLSNLIMVTVNPAPAKPGITRNGTDLVSSSSSGNQWYKDGAAISGATGTTFKPVDAGNYSVKVTANGCSSPESDKYQYTVTGVINIDNTHYIKLNPNPVKDRVLLDFNLAGSNTVTVQIVDINGRICKTLTNQASGTQVSFTDLTNGLYIVKIYTRNQQQHYTMQLVKQ